MWFGVLGPLLAGDGDRLIGVPAGRQRVLLAALLVRAGQVVPADALAEAVWDGSPPPEAAVTLRSHVSRLRRALGAAAGARVRTCYPGYLIEASGEEVDLLRFGSLTRQGGLAARAGQWELAWDLLSEGLGLWRGEPLADVPSEVLRREQVPALERARLEAAEWRADAGLRLGRHGELVAELQSLTAAHPLHEQFHRQLMLALARCGRQAEALQAYQDARELLAEELGTEPGAALRDLHQQVLTGHLALAEPAAYHRAGVVPRELPAAVAGFAGRAAELQELDDALLDRAARRMPPAVVISAISGTAGVGKTALAVQWAHRAANRFPDGQLYVNLRGYDPGRPVPANDALAGFLRSLGVPDQDIPPGQDERAARYRSQLAGRRVLVVLDNAGSEEQVRPLLPGSTGCAVLVTSRDSLAGLVARDGATRLELDLLPPAEAESLLRALIGRRAEQDPGAAAALAAQCCRLPLALRVAAEQAAARSDVPLAALAAELAGHQRRLDVLDAGGDPRSAVRAVFSCSYRHLEDEACRTFRLAGLHSGADFDPYAAAALTGRPLEKARTVLDTLARAHLIQPARPGRYSMHDLLRAYARELSDGADGQEQQLAALTRLWDYYLETCSLAMDALFPGERRHRPPPDTPVPPVTEPAAARAWLAAEGLIELGATVRAAGHSWPGNAAGQAAAGYLDHDSGFPQARVNSSLHHRDAGKRAGRRAAQVTALHDLSAVAWRPGSYQQACDQLPQTLALLGQAGDRAGQARALFNFGVREEVAGLYERAAAHYREALAIAAETGARGLECLLRINLGSTCLWQGLYAEAVGHLHPALSLCRETGDRSSEAHALAMIGEACLGQGQHDEAARHLRAALALYRELGNQAGEVDALNNLGDVLLAAGQPDRARAEYAAALGLADQTGDKYEQARAHHGIGQACRAGGDPGEARRHWQQALPLFTKLGMPEADQIRAELATAQDGGHPEHDPPPTRRATTAISG